MNRRTILGIAAALAVVAVVVAVSGGFRTTVGGLRISVRSPLPIAIIAVVASAAWFFLAKRAHAIDADLESAWRFFGHHSQIVVAIAIVSATIAGVFATRSAAGADASGYLSEAAAWTRLEVPIHVELLAQDFPEIDGWMTTPLGWRPRSAGTQSPTYPPGLPLLMAIPHAIAGINGASMVVVASAAIAIVATALLAFQLGGSLASVIAAVLLAFTPVFIHHSIQPMSDVPVTAAWMTCFYLVARRGASDALAGMACGVAILIRPNLAPLALVPLWLAQRRIAFAAPVAVAGLTLAMLQWTWYGSPLRSGYGSADELFALSNVVPNASRYFTWLMTSSPILLISAFGFFRLRRERHTPALFAFVVLVVVSYLVYAVFDDWSYLRFLLPALAILAVFAAVELAAWIERRPATARAAVLFAVLLVVTAYGLWTARTHDAFSLAGQLRRVSQVADYINADLPPAAVIVSGEQSGAMRYYADRPILRWEAATPDALGTAMATLESSRRPVYIVLDAWEDGLFRAKFSSLPSGALDWPPILDAGTSHRTRLWKLSDRAKFLSGENLSTIRVP